ncbi:MAG TPA: sigma-70 family RNA polymerase sigma factor [Phycisphaerae bacterium]|nr:sigma-70 family RNA polymerase sigma factor [Phycisphaerae bacterium]
MDRASSGEDDAFAELAAAMQDDLYRFALAHGLAAPDAAEATQETLLRAYRARKKWQTGADAVSWMFGIAMNVVRELRRKANRQAIRDVGPEVLSGLAADNDRPSTDERMELERVWQAIAALPLRQREAITCRFLRRMSVRDTAGVMGCAEGTVKAAVSAALGNLRKMLKASTGDETG